MSRLSVAFVVQGEGRGHMTQALALASFLRDAGHEVSTVLVGSSPYRSVPAYFRDGMGAGVETFEAPTQVPDRDGRGVSVTATARDAARRMPRFFAGGLRVHRAARHADVVVNFLDLVGGASRVLFRTATPAVAVAHNYVFLHPALRGAPGGRLARRLVLGWARATAWRCERIVALSFGPLHPEGGGAAGRAVDAHRREGDAPGAGRDALGPRVAGGRDRAPRSRLLVAPPLLRPALSGLAPRDDGHLLAYALNAGYGDLLAAWQRRHPDVTVHCYVDGGAAALREPCGPGFHAHGLDDRGFLHHLAGCRAFVGSAGFESICEAFHLGKPVLAVPTAGQHEQTLNAWDAERAGAARAGGYEDLDDFWRRPAAPPVEAVRAFRAWAARAPEVLVDAVERAAARGRGGGDVEARRGGPGHSGTRGREVGAAGIGAGNDPPGTEAQEPPPRRDDRPPATASEERRAATADLGSSTPAETRTTQEVR